MITFTFAGDESGDVSFNFAKGASRYFVATVIGTQYPDNLRGVLEKLRRDSKLPGRYEFGYHKLSSESLRTRVFATIANTEFDIWGILVDKTILPEAYKAMSGLDFYLYFVSELICQIPNQKRQGGTLILDEFGYPDQTKDELRRIMKARNIEHKFNRISIRRSQSEPLIQIADLVAGAIWRRDTRNDSGAFEAIERKIKKLVVYGG